VIHDDDELTSATLDFVEKIVQPFDQFSGFVSIKDDSLASDPNLLEPNTHKGSLAKASDPDVVGPVLVLDYGSTVLRRRAPHSDRPRLAQDSSPGAIPVLLGVERLTLLAEATVVVIVTWLAVAVETGGGSLHDDTRAHSCVRASRTSEPPQSGTESGSWREVSP
jgi:hypothetical protein